VVEGAGGRGTPSGAARHLPRRCCQSNGNLSPLKGARCDRYPTRDTGSRRDSSVTRCGHRRGSSNRSNFSPRGGMGPRLGAAFSQKLIHHPAMMRLMASAYFFPHGWGTGPSGCYQARSCVHARATSKTSPKLKCGNECGSGRTVLRYIIVFKIITDGGWRRMGNWELKFSIRFRAL
jgi:hypothetical protein